MAMRKTGPVVMVEQRVAEQPLNHHIPAGQFRCWMAATAFGAAGPARRLDSFAARVFRAGKFAFVPMAPVMRQARSRTRASVWVRYWLTAFSAPGPMAVRAFSALAWVKKLGNCCATASAP